LKNDLAYYSAGVAAVNSKVVGLAPDKKKLWKFIPARCLDSLQAEWPDEFVKKIAQIES
jgi:hypothetical protein